VKPEVLDCCRQLLLYGYKGDIDGLRLTVYALQLDTRAASWGWRLKAGAGGYLFLSVISAKITSKDVGLWKQAELY